MILVDAKAEPDIMSVKKWENIVFCFSLFANNSSIINENEFLFELMSRGSIDELYSPLELNADEMNVTIKIDRFGLKFWFFGKLFSSRLWGNAITIFDTANE